MIIVNYKSKSKLKEAIGKSLKCIQSNISAKSWKKVVESGPFFVTNSNRTFTATVGMIDGKIASVR